MTKPIIIIGSGLAGYTLAKAFRALDKETPLMIITAHAGRFYSKPLLSTALTQQRTVIQLATASAQDMEKTLNATIKTKVRVNRVDPHRKSVFIEKDEYPYSKLVLACGAEVIRPPLLGDAVQEVRYVNDLEDYTLFREVIADKKRIGVLGAGLVGCELANDLANAGYDVDVIAPARYPVERLLPEEMGMLLQNTLEGNGVTWHLKQLASAVNRTDHGYTLTLPDRQLEVDVVLSSIGLRPRVSIAQRMGLEINRGIVVDPYLQTSLPDVYALGDCAEVNGLVQFFLAPLRLCAETLAKTLAGEPTEVNYPAMPVSIKTPACPIVVCPPPPSVEGEWTLTGEAPDLKGLFYDAQHVLRGFALAGRAVRERLVLTKLLSEASH